MEEAVNMTEEELDDMGRSFHELTAYLPDDDIEDENLHASDSSASALETGRAPPAAAGRGKRKSQRSASDSASPVTPESNRLSRSNLTP